MSTTSTAVLPLSQLRSDVAGPVIGPDDAAYEGTRRVFLPWIDRRPAAIVQALDADDVAAVVTLAREHGLELAVRGGGHSAAGHGASDGGVVLDLSRLKRLELDVERRLGWAEAGLTAGEVTNAAGAYGLAVPFGDTASVGIGGLTLGGGVGYLARLHGLTIDSLEAAELVTADGRLLRVDGERNPELFWAIRGGGGNFGVATRFRYRLHPLDRATGGMLVLPATPETLADLAAAAAEAPDELTAIANVTPAPPLPFVPQELHGRTVIAAMLLYAGAGDAAEEALAPFRALATPIADLVRPLAYQEMFPAEEHGPGQLAVVRTLLVDRLDRDDAGRLLERLRTTSAAAGFAQLRVLGGAVARVPSAATAFAHRTRGAIVTVGAAYAEPEEAALHAAWARETADELRRGEDGAYVNFVGDEGPARVREAYPGETWHRLVAVKRRWDPENLFRLNQNVPPAGKCG